MLYICKKNNYMTVQTAFRFSPELIDRLKKRARREHKSVNQYVEEVLTRSLDSGHDSELDVLFSGISVSEGIPASILNMRTVSASDIVLDERCHYILEK